MTKNLSTYTQETLFRQWWNSRTFLQQRLLRLCLSMLVMILCFPLYYLGLFGSTDGPLNPSRMGDALAGFGVTKTHSMVFFLSFLIIAVSWNWIYNAVSLWLGSRLYCNSRMGDNGIVCGARVKRENTIQRKTGRVTVRYICTEGHKRLNAHFHPIKKGSFSHSLWIISLCFCLIILFMS